MVKQYKISNEDTENILDLEDNLFVYEQATNKDKQDFIKQFNLPNDVFDFDGLPHVAPRIEQIYNDHLGNTLIFVLSNVIDTPSNTDVEFRLETHTFILGDDQLHWFMNTQNNSALNSDLLDDSQSYDSLQSVIMHVGLKSYMNFTEELNKQKEIIDKLNAQVKNSSNRTLLIDVSDTEKNLVLLQHTIDTQETAFTKLLDNEVFIEKLNEPHLVHDIKWYNRQVKKLVNVYRDLLDSTSSLFSDIMSNHLNILMKFLSSISIVLAASNLIAGMWGMNTGGLPFENHPYGSFIMFGVVLFVGSAVYIYLKNKNYFDS